MLVDIVFITYHKCLKTVHIGVCLNSTENIHTKRNKKKRLIFKFK